MNFNQSIMNVQITKMRLNAKTRSTELSNILGQDRILYAEGHNFQVSLKGSKYRLSFCYIFGLENNKIETALINPEKGCLYISALNYEDVRVHNDTTETCLEEIKRVEDLLNIFANKIRNGWLKYKKRKDAAIVIQHAYRRARDDPKYALCEKIQIQNMENIGYEFSN